jgi:hypothetical protein
MSGFASNPDGVIRVSHQGRPLHTIYLESKTDRLYLTAEQLANHWKLWCEDSGLDKYVLAITPRESDKTIVASLNNKNIRFISWGTIVEILGDLFSQPPTPFIVSQYIEYGELSREFRNMTFEKDDIDAYIRSTQREVRTRLCSAIRSALDNSTFGDLGIVVKDRFFGDHWGRFGFEYTLGSPPDALKCGQWFFCGIYESDLDHGIPFKKNREPELAFFLDIDPKAKPRLLADSNLCLAISRLEENESGFEQNLTKKLTKNDCRLLAHRTPLSVAPTTPKGIRDHFTNVIESLLVEPEIANLVRFTS